MTSYFKQYATENFSKILSWSETSNKFLELPKVVDWCIETPRCTTFRVNTLLYRVEDVLQHIKENLNERLFFSNVKPPDVRIHESIAECIVIDAVKTSRLDLTRKPDEIIVDPFCGASVLRGAHVFAPGVMGMLPQTGAGDLVSVYADLSSKCLKGFKKVYEDDGKLFVGNGIALMNRYEIFDGKPHHGVAIRINNPASGLCMVDFPKDMGIIQNFPSIICTYVLDPKPGEMVLDMCAAPGNKTTHIAAYMKNEGTVVAIDRPSKIAALTRKCSELGITCVRAFGGDSKKILGTPENCCLEGPPFPPNSFDRILLDTTCSNTGQRPMLVTAGRTEGLLRSLAELQKKFLLNAVELLKPGGVLVYTTCSILCEENECNVAWVLQSRSDIELLSAEPVYGNPGLPGCGLSEEQRKLVQRFDSGLETKEESIGFFIAKLRKKIDI